MPNFLFECRTDCAVKHRLTEDGRATLCGVPLYQGDGPFLPDIEAHFHADHELPQERLCAKCLRKATVTFREQWYNERSGNVEAIIHITEPAFVPELAAKAIKRGRLVLFKEADGSITGYEMSERRRMRYPHYGTDAQTREPVKQFPWEG